MYRLAHKVLLCVGLALVHYQAQSIEEIQIAILLDGEVKREIISLQQIKREIVDLTAGEFNVVFPEDKIIHGQWQVNKIRNALMKLLDDPTVDIIIANGLLSSHEASKIKNLNKPVLAPVVADRVLQQLPYINGKSGKQNYVYISDDRTVEQDLRQFHELIDFQHLGIIVDSLFLEALPELKGTTYTVQEDLGFTISFFPVTDDPLRVLDEISAEIDAVYLPPLFRFSKQEMATFADRLIEMKLPSFSLLGREELEFGLLATLSGRDIDTIRYARRIALDVQSILLGTKAADLKVDLEQPPKLAINMRTARAIDYSPKWREMEVADLLFEDPKADKQSLSFIDAIQQAVASNLSLQVNRLDLALAQDQITNARSPLLPQLNIGSSISQIDRARAGLTQAQRSSDADISASQIVYSESARAGYEVAKLLEQAEDAALRANILDVIQQSANAYLQLLQTGATEKVRQSNVNVTETNLELAETRLKIGYSDRSEVLRWQSQLATDRRNLYIAKSQRQQAETELKRVLNIPLSEQLPVTDDGIRQLLTILDSDRFKRFYDNPLSFDRLTEFEVERALNLSPEIEQLEYVISSNERQLLAAKRAYYVPDVSVNAQYGRNIERGGLGQNNSNLNDEQWSIGLQATLPLYAGGARKFEVSRSANTLLQNQYSLLDIKQQIDSRVRASLQQASGSYPAIRLSKDAALAGKENLALVTDAYSKGVVSITDLINAQDAALAANLAAVEAQYAFMVDWINIQRAIGNYDLLLTPDGFDGWYQELIDYFASTSTEFIQE